MIKANMKFIKLLFAFSSFSFVINNIGDNSFENYAKSKILFEYNSNGCIAIEDDEEDLPPNLDADNDNFSIQIMLDYNPYNESLYQKHNSTNLSFVEFSKKYHTNEQLGETIKKYFSL